MLNGIDGVRRGGILPDASPSCWLCRSGAGRYYVGMGAEKIWQEIESRIHRLGLSSDPGWNVQEERQILNATWHFRQREPAEQGEMKME